MYKEKKIVRAVAYVLCALPCFIPMTTKADVCDERLEFIATTGTQWIDTGLLLNFKRSRFRINFRVVERPTGRVALCGSLSEKDNVDGYNAGKRRSFAVRIGSDTVEGEICYRVYPSFTGSEDNGYLFPITGSYAEGASIETEGFEATALFNGKKFGGYYDASRPDEFMDAGKSFCIGNVNNAGEGLLTPAGAMPKIHWYGAKFWTDGELVGDFVPAMSGGVAGFFDTVTQRFFPSQGEDQFIAPNRIEWNGGGDVSDFSDGDNWNGGVAPSGIGDVALFPADAEIGATFSDVNSFFTKLGAVHLAGSGTLLAVTSATESASIYAPVFGKGTYRVASGSEAHNYSIYADSGLFEGAFEFTNAAKNVETYVMNAAGIGGRSTASFHADGSDRRLSFAKGVPSRAHWRITRPGQFLFAPEGVNMYGGLAFAGNSGMSFNANANFWFGFCCSITNETDVRRTVYMNAGEYRLNDASHPKHFGLMQVQTENLAVNSPVSFSAQAPDYVVYNQCNVAVRNSGAKGLTFGAENVFQTNLFLLLGYAEPVEDQKRCTVDLNGFNQRIGTLCVYTKEFDAKTVWNTNLVLKSEAPATLTIYGSCRCDRSMIDGADAKSVFPGRVSGALSVTLDSRDEVNPGPMFSPGDGAIRFSNPFNDTVGSLAVMRGTVQVMESGAFTNLANVTVSGEGVAQIDTPDVGNGNEDFFVSVTNATTARLSIAAGVTLKAKRAYANEHWLAKGRWSSTASDGVRQCAWLSGGGILEVEEYGGPTGMRVILR